MLKDFFLTRLWKDPVRRTLVSIILFYPLIESLFYLKDIFQGGGVYIPNYAFFLTCNYAGINHVFQSILLWFLPVYTLILTANDCIEDYNTGIRNVLISKIGKKKYVKQNLIKSFCFTFVLIFFALMIDLLIVHILFNGGWLSPYSDEFAEGMGFFGWQVRHRLVSNILFSVITAFVGGLISMVGTISAIMIHDKKIVYGITMVFWFIPFLKKYSLMLAFQPFSEYSLSTIAAIIVEVTVAYSIYILIGYIREVYFGKKNI